MIRRTSLRPVLHAAAPTPGPPDSPGALRRRRAILHARPPRVHRCIRTGPPGHPDILTAAAGRDFPISAGSSLSKGPRGAIEAAARGAAYAPRRWRCVARGGLLSDAVRIIRCFRPCAHHGLSDRGVVKREPVGVVDQAIEDGVRRNGHVPPETGIFENNRCQQGIDGKLVGDEHGAGPVVVLDNFHEPTQLAPVSMDRDRDQRRRGRAGAMRRGRSSG